MASPSAFRPAKPAWADREALGTAVLLLGVLLLAYGPALTGGFLWDDDAHVTKAALRSLSGLWRIWFEAGATQQYYPLVHSAFWVEHRLWGDQVLGYHLANVAEHAAAAWLLWVILRVLEFPAPRLAALVFALHPVEVESVAWISEQKNTLSAIFYLAAALVYLRFDATRRRNLYSAALALFVLALLSKSVTATLPAALLVVLWWRRGRLEWRRDVVPLLPWFVLGAASGLFTAWVERKFIGAEGADFSFTFLQRLYLAGRVILFYLRTLGWPAHLMFIYPRWSLAAGGAWDCLPLLGVLALVGVLVAIARRRRGPLAGFLLFAGTLLPALGFVNVYPFRFSFVADHFQYLASIGILVPLTWGYWWLVGRVAPAAKFPAGVALAALLGFLTSRQARDYRSTEALYRSTLAKNPSAWLIHYNLAVALGMGPEHLAETISEYQATIRLKDDHWEAHNNLGSALLKLPGRRGEAIAQYEAALRHNPAYAEAENNLGIALEGEPGREQEAEDHLRAAIRLRPDYAAAHSNLGTQLMRKPGGRDEARDEYARAVHLAPEVPDYHYNLANALALQPATLPDAVTEYRAALALRPAYAEAHSNLGAVLAHLPGQAEAGIAEDRAALALNPGGAEIHANLANALSKYPDKALEAMNEYRAAVRLDSADARSHYGLGLLLARVPGGLADAVAEFQSAADLQPDFVEAHYALGIAFAMGGRRPEAIVQLQRTLELRPDFTLAQRALRRLQGSPP